MKFKIETWSINKLLQEYDGKRLNLNPPYQRNDIWTTKAQEALILTIKSDMPIPNFFLHEKKEGGFDIADGQQRTRAILQYRNKQIQDGHKNTFTSEKEFLDFLIPIQIISSDVSEEDIREFYVKVNKTGLRLNNPELTKASFFNSDVLKFVEEITDMPEFRTVGIFSPKQQDRMIDREFVEELVAFLKFGVTDKKEGIIKLYSLNDNEFAEDADKLKRDFKEILEIIDRSRAQFNFAKSRYSQRNDFYTLFGFINAVKPQNVNFFNTVFELLFKIQGDISPSNDECKPLQDYALNCVSQSNSKKARENRSKFMEDLILNGTSVPNKTQEKVAEYYELGSNFLIHNESFYIINPENITLKFLID